MAPEVFHNSLVLTGPTGSGKSRLALELAAKLNAEIISMDSMALYRGMDIGTAKPSLDDRKKVPHYLIDVLAPWESATVAWWLDQAASCCREIEAKGKQALFVGGTPFYLKAMLFGLFEGPGKSPEIRHRLEQEAQTKGALYLHSQLEQVDPASANKLHPNDVRRVIRALEVWELTGQPLSSRQQQWASPKKRQAPECIWIDLPRDQLYQRINHRVDCMFSNGLVDEVTALRELPQPLSREAKQALGYKEVLEYLDEEQGLEETVTKIKTRTRNFAKRQITWFRHLPGCRPIRGELTSNLWDRRMKEE